MKTLSKIQVFLHKVGINTRKYYQYCKELQRELDYQHLSTVDFVNKYCMKDLTKYLSTSDLVELLDHPHLGKWVMYYREYHYSFWKSYVDWVDEWRDK